MIIGVLGLIGSGKDTVGSIFKEYDFERISFASKLKDTLSVMFGWPRHLLEGDTEESRKFRETEDKFWTKKLGRQITPRYMLQHFGTEIVRSNLHSQYWVFSIEKSLKKDVNYVITDTRFKNEIEWLKSQNAFLIEVRRGILPHWHSVALQANNGNKKAEEFMKANVHLSEWDWIGTGVDYVIENDGSMEELEAKVKNCLCSFLGSNTMCELV